MKKLWTSFAVVLVVSLSVLGWIGTRIYQQMPPLPARIVDTNGAVVVPKGDIGRGQNVWQALGGIQVGSIWGHGSYVAPDWPADCKPYEQLSPEDQGNCVAASNRFTRGRSFPGLARRKIITAG